MRLPLKSTRQRQTCLRNSPEFLGPPHPHLHNPLKFPVDAGNQGRKKTNDGACSSDGLQFASARGRKLAVFGERLEIERVANLLLKVVEKRNFLGKSTWHLQAFAHTENPLRMVFALDDQFDSYSDAASLVSMQYEMRLNEKGQTVNSIQRMTPSSREPAPADAIAARVLPGTRDPLGMMQFLRTVDWNKTPQVRSPVYDGHKLYDVYARIQARSEPVTVPAGSFNTMKIELRVFDQGPEMKDAHFTLYLTNTDARMPVLLEALMPFATARVELVKAQ